MSIHVTIPGEPVPYMRVTRDRFGVARVPKRMREAKQIIGRAVQAKYIIPEPLTGDIGVTLRFHTDSAAKDIDNLTKLCLDALNGVVWRDDRQVVSCCAYLIRKCGVPQTDIVVRWWDVDGDHGIAQRASDQDH